MPQFDPAKPLCSVAYTLPVVLELAAPDPGERVLDIGCGVGAITAAFADRSCDCVGIDLQEERIATARERHPNVRFAVATAGPRLLDALGEEPFDIVVSTEVIEHVFSPLQFVAAAREALKPRGRLVVTTPYHGYLKNLLLAVAGKWDVHHTPWIEGSHIKFWSRRSLTDFLETHGFEDVRFSGAGRLPWLWKSMVLAATRR